MGNITKKIYIVHGWTYTLDAWSACVEGLTAAGFEPVMLRVPGLTSPSEKVWTLDEYVAWLDAALPNESDVASGATEPITLIAHSNGGRIAIALAAKKPHRIAELVLMDAAGIVHNEMPLRLKRALFGTLAKAGRKFTSRVFLRKLFHKIILAHDYARAPENMRETMKNLITVDLTDRLSNITARTLILWGNHDKATPVMDAHLMHRLISGSKLVVFEGIGHSPHKDVPERVVKEIGEWLDQK
jgi:pimeloyl-ACP methyl ester carboxylesterase